jgi:hypothetical protein
LQVALGGISLGTGIFVALLTYLIEIGFVPLTFPRIILIFVSAVSILASILNITARTRKIF